MTIRTHPTIEDRRYETTSATKSIRSPVALRSPIADSLTLDSKRGSRLTAPGTVFCMTAQTDNFGNNFGVSLDSGTQ